jgi:hypothetical protein
MSRDELQRRVHRFIDDSLADAPTEAFSTLALDLHRWQAAHAPVVAALTAAPPGDWTDLPAVPVDLFKELRVGTVPPGAPGPIFRTSGTTQGRRGEHALHDTALYDHGALAWALRCLPSMPQQTVALLVDPHEHPDASLSHMVRLFNPPERTSWHLGPTGVDRRAALNRLTEPTFFATTAFALADWLDSAPPPLPEGSILMVTGGFKGRTTTLDADQLHALAAERLRPAHIATEYGMTELSSQLWGTPTTPFRPPPWLRALAVSPETGRPLPPGAPGQLRFYDLANLDSTIGVETLDRGVVHDDGSVTLLGRLAGAEVRGCSLTVEEAWQARAT